MPLSSSWVSGGQPAESGAVQDGLEYAGGSSVDHDPVVVGRAQPLGLSLVNSFYDLGGLGDLLGRGGEDIVGDGNLTGVNAPLANSAKGCDPSGVPPVALGLPKLA